MMRSKWLPVVLMMLLPAGGQSQVDTAALLKRAKDAQKKFEQLHRNALPTQYSGDSDRQCDARIGRICYWNDTGEVNRPEEPAKITKARLALIDTLKSIRTVLPEDEWLLGETVFYQVRAGQAQEAYSTAGNTDTWWGAALRGYAAHYAENFDLSEREFAKALKLMPARLRCEWTDLAILFPKEERNAYKKLSCEKRFDVNKRIWFLADPLYSVPGNERQTAHYSRHVANTIQRSGEPTNDMRWGKDMEEVWLRYGPPNYYTRSWTRSMEGSGRTITGQDAARNYHYLPVVIPFSDSQINLAAHWDLTDREAQEGFALPSAARIQEVSLQTAVFKRNDKAIIIAGAGRILPNSQVELQSFTPDGPLPYTSGSTDNNSNSAPGSFLVIFSQWIPQMISVEAHSSKDQKAVRYRSWWTPPVATGGVQLSDIMMYVPVDSLAQVSDPTREIYGEHLRFLSVPIVRGDGALGLYWEIYGLDTVSTNALPVSLTVSRVGDSGIQRFFGILGLMRRHTPLTMKWNETTAALQEGILKRSLIINLENIPPGRYKLRLNVRTSAGTAVSSREIEIR